MKPLSPSLLAASMMSGGVPEPQSRTMGDNVVPSRIAISPSLPATSQPEPLDDTEFGSISPTSMLCKPVESESLSGEVSPLPTIIRASVPSSFQTTSSIVSPSVRSGLSPTPGNVNDASIQHAPTINKAMKTPNQNHCFSLSSCIYAPKVTNHEGDRDCAIKHSKHHTGYVLHG